VPVRDILPEPDFALRAWRMELTFALRKYTDRQAKRLAFAAMCRNRTGENLPPHWLPLIHG
jgi:hypothetical protein